MLLAGAPSLGLGADLELGPLETELPFALFCERPGIVFAVRPERAPRLFQAARERSLLAWPIGSVSPGGRLRVSGLGAEDLSWSRAEMEAARDLTLQHLWNEELE